MADICTLEELRGFFRLLELMPEARTPDDAEQVLGPLIDALQDWSEDDLGALTLHLMLILAVRRGEAGIAVFREVLMEISDVLQQREVIWGNVN